MKYSKKFLENKQALTPKKWFTFYFLPITLLFLWIGLSFYYIFYLDFSFTILTYYHPKSVIQNFTTKELLAGQKITSEFQAKTNHLALVSIRFNTFDRENNDFLTLRLKEKNQPTWYNETSFRTTLSDKELYHFGFAPIADSKGKTYIFEIESRYGKPGNAVGISDIEPVFGTKYQFPKSLIIQNKSTLFTFAQTKIKNILDNNNVGFAVFVFALPLCTYCLFLTKKRIYYILALSLLSIAMGIEIITKAESNNLIVLTLIVILVWNIKENKYKNRYIYMLGITFFIACSSMIVLNLYPVALKLAAWSFIFFVIATIDSLTKLIQKHV